MLKKIIKMLHENQHTLAIRGHMINALVQSSSIARESSQLPVNLIHIKSGAEFDELEKNYRQVMLLRLWLVTRCK